MMTDIILFGIQGSGKGTQAQLLLDKNPDRFSYLSTGDVFRALSSSPNAIGDYVKTRIATGAYINDKVTNAIFECYVHTVMDTGKYMLLDGYPRSLVQMELMIQFLQQQGRSVMGIYFILDDASAMERMMTRARADDTPDACTSRIQQFKESTLPVIDLFRASFPCVEIDASQSVADIQALVAAAIA